MRTVMSPAALSYIARHARGPLMRSQPDHRLVALVRSGSEPAFEALVARYRDPLLRYCRRILSADRAEDAVQQTFVNAHAAIAAGRAGDDLRPWLYRIAHNVAIDQLRQRRAPEEQLSEELAGGDVPEEILTQRERLTDILAAIEDLPARQRDALVLRELEGRSYEEIAFALGVGDGAVRQLLNRARHAMRSAAATVVPPALLRWTPDQLGRTAEVAAGAGAGTVAARTWLGALIATATVGGVVAVPIGTDDVHPDDRPAPAQERETHPVVDQADRPVRMAKLMAPAASRSEAPRPPADRAQRVERVERPTTPVTHEAEPRSPERHRSDHVVEVPADDLSKEELQLEVESHDDGEEVMDAGDEHAPEPEPEGEDHADETTPDE
jgi:RNA polymerase sigma factor (sigma-70 family)